MVQQLVKAGDAIVHSTWVAYVALTDDPMVTEAMEVLTSQGVAVDPVPADAVAEALEPRPPAMAVLRSGALTIDGLEALRILKSANVPVLAVVDDLTEETELILLHSGAWEVLGMPTSDRRLRARISTLCEHVTSRRSSEESQELPPIDNVTINLRRHEVAVDGQPLALTKTEFDLLVALARDPHAVLSRDELLQRAGTHGQIGPRSLESHLSRLRLKVQSAGGPRLVESVRGVGYRLRS